MIRYCITDRKLTSVESLLRSGRVDWVQIRDKDLPARDLIELVRAAVPWGGRILVNTRVDVAIAAGAAGVHLPAGSMAPQVWRAITPAGFLIGVSCHTLEEVVQAENEGADYVVFGPVFAPLSKTSDLIPRGLQELSRACASVKIPVLALGGITHQNALDCTKVGAAGIAGIALFQSC